MKPAGEAVEILEAFDLTGSCGPPTAAVDRLLHHAYVIVTEGARIG